jgi:hypothetical protein
MGDMFSAAFSIVRHNRAATIGAASLVAALTMVLPVLGSIVGTWGTGAFDDFTDESATVTDGQLIAIVGVFGSFALGALVQMVGLVLVTAMITRLTVAAGTGVTMGMGQAWAATRGKRWRVVGLVGLGVVAGVLAMTLYLAPFLLIALYGADTLSFVVWGLFGLAVLVPLGVWAWVRFGVLSLPALINEDAGVFGALGRSYRLSRGSFWRIFGISLLTGIVVSVAGSILAMPFSLAGSFVPIFAPDLFVVSTMVSQAGAMVISAAVTTPFMAAISALLYVDRRFRTEAFDVVLMEQAGLLDGPAGR